MSNFKCELRLNTVVKLAPQLRTAAWKSAHRPTWVLTNGRHDLNFESMPLWDLRKRLGSPRKPIPIEEGAANGNVNSLDSRSHSGEGLAMKNGRTPKWDREPDVGMWRIARGRENIRCSTCAEFESSSQRLSHSLASPSFFQQQNVVHSFGKLSYP